jgi:TPP-dependent pyruvate/acetoin dehydrogenase alpha subunit
MNPRCCGATAPQHLRKKEEGRLGAFFASRAACPGSSAGELGARSICRSRDSTTGQFRSRPFAIARGLA